MLRGQMHRWTHLGDKKLVQAVKGLKVYILDLRFWARKIEQYKVCQQVNAYAAKSKQGKRPRREGKSIESIGKSILQMLSQENMVTNTF